MMPCTNKGRSPSSANDTTTNDASTSRAFNSQKEIWQLEQQIVASLVQVPPDPPVDSTIVDDNPLFHLVKDDHHDVFSFSSVPELYGGVDVSFAPEDNDRAVAVYVIVDKRTMEVLYHDYEYFHLEVPYIPGYLAFREIQPMEMLIQRQLKNRPDMTPIAILVDGNGIFHPRRAGIACFVGTRTNIPTIGIGKTLYYEAGWTREIVNVMVDTFLEELHSCIMTSSTQNSSLASRLSRYRGLILKREWVDPKIVKIDNNIPIRNGEMMISEEQEDSKPTANPLKSESSAAVSHSEKDRRKNILRDLAPYCNGMGVYLKGCSEIDGQQQQSEDGNHHHYHHSTASRFPVLACALVGHGGQIAASSKSEPVPGTKNPIYVSVGHKISLQQAVQISASLSMARIPEPVRQADLLGRSLLRKRELRCDEEDEDEEAMSSPMPKRASLGF